MINSRNWQNTGVRLPTYDVQKMVEETRKTPVWLHFGAGNAFRALIAVLQQRLLESNYSKVGIIAAETHDTDIIDKVYVPHDNMFLNVILGSDGSLNTELVATVAETIAIKPDDISSFERLKEVFCNPSLQIVSFTITEKGYMLRDANGNLQASAIKDFEDGPGAPCHSISIVCAMLHKRYQAGRLPLALVSVDNLAKNGDVLKASIVETADMWQKSGFVDSGFLKYLRDRSSVSFPLTVIDKITPRPDEAVAEQLRMRGISDIEPIVTSKHTHIAPFVNSERPEYLVIESNFPASRPPLEKAGVFFTDRETVSKFERMKVSACLNPLHTSMAVYGCLLGFTRISEMMKDTDIIKLINRLGYVEGLPVASDPGILSPKVFLDEVINERFPNPFLPDAPQRIATDTSQKVGVRFGETVKGYKELGYDLNNLVSLPLSIAGWLRYLLAVDDEGGAMEVSPDPLKESLQKELTGIVWNDQASYNGQILGILKNEAIFGSDLTQTVLGKKIEEMFIFLLSGKGAARKALKHYLYS